MLSVHQSRMIMRYQPVLRLAGGIVMQFSVESL
jgi:hypothetical protein